jgi:isoleucyl-tRNA synthetase
LAAIDEQLSARMEVVRDIASLGRSARMDAKLKVRQPLAKVEIVLSDRQHQAWLEEHAALICDELNVKQAEFPAQADQYIDYTVLPDLKKLGPRLGKLLPAVRKALADADAATLLAKMTSAGQVQLDVPGGPVSLSADDVQVRLSAKPGWSAAQGRSGVVVLSTEITPELAAEGLAREFVHAVQTRRKDLGCEYEARIRVMFQTASGELSAAVLQFADYIRGETLAIALEESPVIGAATPLTLAGHEVALEVTIVPRPSGN